MKKNLSLIFICFIFYSVEIHSQWKTITLPQNFYGTEAMDVCDKNTCLIAVYSPPNLFLTKNGGKSFNTIANFLNKSEFLSDVSIIDSLNFWVATRQRILYTSDSGKNWVTQFNDTSQTPFINYIKMFDLNNGVAMGDAKNSTSKTAILRTSNGGKNWINVNETLIGMNSGDQWRKINFPSSQVGYFYEYGVDPPQIYKTIDGGKKWEAITTPIGIRRVKFYNEMIGCLLGGNASGNIMCTTFDGGKTWPYQINFGTVGLGMDVEFTPNNPARIIVAVDNNIFCSPDTGRTWKLVKFQSQDLIGSVKFADEKTGWILSGRNIVYKTENADYLVTDVKKENHIPTQFSLSQNFPNPFNPETNINYQITEAANVSLKVYDMLGREVATLVDEFKQAGIFNSKFSILNLPAGRQGSQLPSGVYFYRFQAGNYVANKKMVVMK